MQPQKMMGITMAQDQKIPVSVRDWNGMKLMVWRSKNALDIIAKAAEEIIPTCEHSDGCPGKHEDTEPCLQDRYELQTIDGQELQTLVQIGCPDRELRMSALVILNAARSFAPLVAVRPAGEPYMAPSREYFSELLGELGALQIEVARLSAKFEGTSPSHQEIEEHNP